MIDIVNENECLATYPLGMKAIVSENGVLRKAQLVGGLIILVLLLAACAAGSNPSLGVPPEGGQVAGFWLGLWHGIISPVTFIISLFNRSVNFYEVHNDGNWYNFGFALGAGILFGGFFRAGHSGRSRH